MIEANQRVQETEVEFLSIAPDGHGGYVAAIQYAGQLGLYKRSFQGMYEIWERISLNVPAKEKMPKIVTNSDKMDDLIFSAWEKAEAKGELFYVYLEHPKDTSHIRRGFGDDLRDGTALVVPYIGEAKSGALVLTVLPRRFASEDLDTRAAVEFDVLMDEVRLNP